MVVSHIVQKGSKSQLTWKDRLGKEVSHYAAGGGHVNVMAYVVSKLGPDCLMATDANMQTPVFYGELLSRETQLGYKSPPLSLLLPPPPLLLLLLLLLLIRDESTVLL